jgi:winged helix DNA-binding protein
LIKLAWDQVLAFRLERHFLTKRAPKAKLLSVASAVCGLHAQAASSPEVALWARVEGLALGTVKRALEEKRTLVRTWTIRDTVHLVPADDLPVYVAVLRPRAEGPSYGWLNQRRMTRKQ